MRTYIIRRLLLMIPTVFLVTLIIFFLIRLIPGSIVEAMVANILGYGVEIDVEAAKTLIETRLGLDVPIITQYGRWVGVWPQADGGFSGLFQGDLGQSFLRPTTVAEEIARRWPVTLQLGIMGLVISQLIALPIGIYSALRQDTWGDYTGRSLAILAIAVPSFWVATLAIVFPSIWWNYMPPIMHVSFLDDPLTNLRLFIAPAIILGMALSGITMRMTRTMMLEVLRQDYIRTAWAKGLRERVVILRHTLKNALIPVITIIGLQMPVLIGGAVVIETIFSLPGMGSLVVTATEVRDYPLVAGIMVIFGVGMVLINLVVDLTYGFLDPRVRYR